MSEKRNRRIIVVVAIFYLIVSILAIFMLQDSDSILADKSLVDVMFADEKTTEVSSVSEGDPERILERWTDTVLPKSTESVTANPAETVTEQKLPENDPTGGTLNGT